ncbi:MAG TPA: helix-turn-helix domain-containing protein [Candidatus Eisenbacteria bacterium]|nr:helix-turn-helix domain-containing protein [Candidatus Eisenbacteria bacterium]
MARSQDTTRIRLIHAAERLFAARGIDAVSLREINRASGAKNAIAVQYHFEDRSGVIHAVLQKHRPDVEARRHAMLDQYEADATPDLRSLAAALVRPWAAKLADPDGGPEYLQIQAELLNRPRPPVETGAAVNTRDSIHRWRSLVGPLLGEDATRLHRRFTAMRLAAGELGRRASTAPHTDDRLFVSHLIDLVAAILAAPVSEETLRLAAARDASRASGRPSRDRGGGERGRPR